jgi:site-specific DNA recombinase
VWDTVQAKLAANAVERSTGARARNPSLLVGLLFDADGNRMTPTHAVKKGRLYRYYVSHPLITQARAQSPDGVRVPALEIEQLVTDRIRDLLGEPANLIEATEPFRFDAAAQRQLLQKAAAIQGRRMRSLW